MLNLKKITIFSAVLLSAAYCWSGSRAADSSAADSLRRATLRDSLYDLQELRKKQCDHSPALTDGFSLSPSLVFEADGTGPSEALATVPLCVPVRFGLSNQLNRILQYGNVAPIAPVYESGALLFATFDPSKGTDNVSTGEFSAVTLLPNNVSRYSAHPAAAAVPEGSFFWENGVFNEDVFSLRFTRPLSERLAVSAFTNYRHFAAMDFSHEGNGVLSFYRSFSPDTTLFTGTGYNPLTNDFTAGLRARWTGSRGNDLYVGLKYADCEDEQPIDKPAPLGARLYFERLNQYRTTLDAGSDHARFGRLFFDLEGRLEDDALVRYKPDSAGTSLVRRDGSNRELSLAARTSVAVNENDTVALIYRVVQTDRTPFIQGASGSLEQTPELSVVLPYAAGALQGACKASAGYHLYNLNDSLGYAPSWSASIEGVYGRQGFRLYTMSSSLPYFISYDSAINAPSPLLDLYRLGGGELSLALGGAGRLIVGCQSIQGLTDLAVSRAWPEGTPPYAQPRLVFLAAPSVGPWHGLTLSSRAFISDRKPLVKGQGALAYAAHPENTPEFIDLRLCFDYWSERDSSTFAARTDWNRPVYDLNAEVAVHVKTFRFFAKVSNVLDRNFAYVPGYYSPGITFRWGISWFLQR